MIDYDMMRWWIYSNYVIYISLMVLAYNTLQETLSLVSSSILRKTIARAIVIMLALFPAAIHLYPFYHLAGPYSDHDSVSNWSRYRHLLKENDYYIPTNPVQQLQWGISKDNEKLPVEIKADDEVNGLQFADAANDFKIRSMLIVNHDYDAAMKDLIVKAYDSTGREIAIPHRLNNFDEKYLYYYFPERIHPNSLFFFNEKIEKINIRPDIHLFGKPARSGGQILINEI